MSTRAYDMAVIGGGAAGLAAAFISNNLGARTLLIEQRRTGGECTFTGCVPSKTLLHAARMLHDAREARAFSTSETAVAPDFEAILKHVHAVRERVYHADDAPQNLERRGIEVMHGRARFTGSHELEITPVDGIAFTIRFRHAVIATGSEPRTLNTSLPHLTNETLFDLKTLPTRMVIAGAGPVGIEMAQAFARLGSRVTVVAPEPRVLPKDDAECAGIVQRSLEHDGVLFMFGRRVKDFQRCDSTRVVILDDTTRLECDAFLVAAGRKPRLDDLGLTAAGVALHDGNIEYDDRCRTSAKHICVSGDVAGWYDFTHAAEHMSRVAVTNALLRLPVKLDRRNMSWTTFTEPELAHAGETEEALRHRRVRFTAYRFAYSRIDRAVTDDRTQGLIKVLADRRGLVLGATITGARAGDVIAEWLLAIKHRLTLRDLSSAIHPYPTYALGGKRLADEWLASRISTTVAPLARLIFRYRSK